MRSKRTGGHYYGMTPPIGKFLNDLANSSLSDIIDQEFVNTRPSVNIVHTESEYEIHLAAPGLTKEAFDITLKNGTLTIQTQGEAVERTYARKEFDYTQFKRSFKVGDEIKPDAISAKYKQGVLVVKLPRKGEEEIRTTISVK